MCRAALKAAGVHVWGISREAGAVQVEPGHPWKDRGRLMYRLTMLWIALTAIAFVLGYWRGRGGRS